MKLINPLIIIRILSTILILETISFLLCLPVVFIYKESPLPFLYSAALTTILSAIMFTVSRNSDINKASSRDGYMAVTLSWLLLTIMGSLPYLFSGTIPSFVDAFFESTSGFTTTGSSILKDVEILPFSILFWRSFTHWIGGLGIIVLVVIILPSLRVNGYQLFSLESSLKEKIHPRTQGIGFRVMFIYLGLSLAQIILLSFGDMNLFDSICHTFGTVATGGFSTKNLSLGYYSNYSQYIIMIFMTLAGISFVVYYYFFKFNFKKVKQNEELWFYISTIIVAGALTSIILLVNTNKTFETSFREGFFNVISILTTTGYSNVDYLIWPLSALLLMFLLLFAGASTGSTTGSIKMARHLLVIKNIRSVFIKIIHTNAVSQIKFSGKTIAWNTNVSIISFVVIYLFIFVIGTIIVSISGYDPLTSASAVASSLGNIGPGLGEIGPINNYSHFPDVIKLFLSLLMMVGRLEIFTIFILFSRAFWKM